MIKIKRKIIASAIFILAAIVGLAGSADAANLNWTADATVTINSVNYTLVSGSAADAFAVGGTTLTVTIPALSTFTLHSSNGYTLAVNNTNSTVQSCSGATNRLVITGDGTEKIITPNTSSVVCTASSSQSNSGSGGGGGGDTTPPGDVTSVIATVAPGKVTLNWTKPTASDFGSQVIYRSTVSGTRGSQIASNLTGTSYIDTSVTNGTTYYYTIHAIDLSGNENTSTAQISAVPGTPTATPVPTPTPTPASTVSPTPTPAVTSGPATPAVQSGVTLYRAEGDHRVYVVKDGKKTHIKSVEEFNAAGYKWADIVVAAPVVVNSYPEASASAAAAKVKVVNTPTLRVRQSNTTKSSTLATVKGNETFTVLDTANGWYKIATSGGVTGWISGAYAVPSEETVVASSSGVAAISITAASLRVRSANSVSGKVLGSVREGEKYSVIEEKDGWYKIKTSKGITGWISGQYAVKQ